MAFEPTLRSITNCVRATTIVDAQPGCTLHGYPLLNEGSEASLRMVSPSLMVLEPVDDHGLLDAAVSHSFEDVECPYEL